MGHASLASKRIEVDVENIGGIDETRVEFAPGVTILAGRNATNRTSFLRALMAALGSDEASLKGDAEEGGVELAVGDETYTRRFHREKGNVIGDGDPYLEDSTLADLFAFLLESNEARRAVARGDDLRELLMRPVDTEAIAAEIDRLRERKQSYRGELDELDELERERSELAQERSRLESDLADLREERDAKAAEVEDYDRDVEETRSERAELEETLDELNDVRSDLESVRFEIDTQRESIETLRTEREELREKVDTAEATPGEEISRIEGRLEALRERKSEVERVVNDLQRIVRFNEEMLDGTDGELADALTESGSGSTDALAGSGTNPTDALVTPDTTVCWTCGSEVASDRIEETIDELRELRVETSQRRREIQTEIDELSERKGSLESSRRERERSRRRLDEIGDEIGDREGTVAELTERREDLADRITELEEAVEELDVVDEYDDLLAEHRELNQLEFRIDQLEDERTSVEGELDEIDERLAERSQLESQIEEVEAELADRRSEIERIEREAVDHFNEQMERVLEILRYDNLERIWIERTTTEGREGRRRVERSTFDLHVVRSSESGVAYEDSIDHLSESEREVTGLVFALAGYLAHDVYETVPFMVLDSLEAIDAERIARIVDHVSDYADALVVALLPEDAAALDDDYERVREI